MGVMATVALFLNAVAALAEGRTDLLRDAKVFSLNSHAVKPDGMTALAKLLQLFGMALSTFIREDQGLLFGSCLVVDMAGHAMDPFLCVFRFHPRLKKSWRYLLVTADAESRIDPFVCFLWGTCTHHDG
jgi:hypothetical protein